MINRGFLDVVSSTWSKETHGLFDYESGSTVNEHFKLKSSGKIFRTDSKCFINKELEEPGSIGLLDIERNLNSFLVSILLKSSKMWLVINKIPQNSPQYSLSEGDQLKFGRIRVKVLKISEKNEGANTFIKQLYSNSEASVKKDLDNKSACRVCLCESESLEDPLIHPCNCAGTMKFIHFNCLKSWIKCKTTERLTEKTRSFYIKDLTCELCKGSFPLVLTNNTQKILLVDINLPNKPFILIEEFRPDQTERFALHAISLDSRESIFIGRGNTSDIKILDISVSRIHCKIYRLNNEFFIEDCNSKFGTLAKVKKSFIIKPKVCLTIQVSRTVFRLEYKVPRTLADCCNSTEVFEDFALITQPEAHDSESDLNSSQIHLAGFDCN